MSYIRKAHKNEELPIQIEKIIYQLLGHFKKTKQKEFILNEYKVKVKITVKRHETKLLVTAIRNERWGHPPIIEFSSWTEFKKTKIETCLYTLIGSLPVNFVLNPLVSVIIKTLRDKDNNPTLSF